MAASAKPTPVKLTKKDMEKYRRPLAEKRSELTREIGKNKDAGEESAEELTQDIVDKATSSYTKEFLFSLSDNERVLAQQIADAIARLDAGVFGTCTNCSSPIAEKRLVAVPWTPYCVDCMELSEKGLLG